MKESTQHAFADYHFHTTLLPRYADLNAGGHISIVAIQNLLTEARMQFQSEKLGLVPWFSNQYLVRPISQATDFMATPDYAVPIACGVMIIGRNALDCHIETALFQHGVCIARQDCLIAAWRNGERIALPSDVLADSPQDDDMPPPAALTGGDHAPVDALRVDISMRYGDLDADAAIGESALAGYAEQARSELMSGLSEAAGIRFPQDDALGILGARIAIDFRRHGPVRGKRYLAVGVSRLGRSSFTVRVGVFNATCCFAVIDTVMVCINPADGRATAIPVRLRHELERCSYDALDGMRSEELRSEETQS